MFMNIFLNIYFQSKINMATNSLKIMIFSWNADGIRLCETLSTTRAQQQRGAFSKFIGFKKDCVTPNFFIEIRRFIEDERPGLVVMTTQDEDISKTYFHAEVLPREMVESGYVMVQRQKLDNIGERASGLMLPNVPGGQPKGSALRVSVYARSDVYPGIQEMESQLRQSFSEGYLVSSLIQNNRYAGAICVYVWHAVYGRMAFIATHLPSGVDALLVKGKNKKIDQRTYNRAIYYGNNLCLANAMNVFVESLDPEDKPDYVFLIGDLNYNISSSTKTTQQIINEITQNPATIKNYRANDELTEALKEPFLKGFKEGVQNRGPEFLPTWKMRRERGDDCVSPTLQKGIPANCYDGSNGIGWHDRILYSDDGSNVVSCNRYVRVDAANMHMSEHAGVAGVYTVPAIN